MKKRKPVVDLAEVRRAVAAYMGSEGCDCCRDIDRHRENKAVLGRLLRVPGYADGSTGHDFTLFRKQFEERK